jgi:hypothetical protein
VPIAEVGIDTRFTELDGRRGAAARQAQIEAAAAMLGIAGRHRVLDVVTVGPRDRGPGSDFHGAGLKLEDLDLDGRSRLGRRDQRGHDRGQRATSSDDSASTHRLCPPHRELRARRRFGCREWSA